MAAVRRILKRDFITTHRALKTHPKDSTLNFQNWCGILMMQVTLSHKMVYRHRVQGEIIRGRWEPMPTMHLGKTSHSANRP